MIRDKIYKDAKIPSDITRNKLLKTIAEMQDAMLVMANELRKKDEIIADYEAEFYRRNNASKIRRDAATVALFNGVVENNINKVNAAITSGARLMSSSNRNKQTPLEMSKRLGHSNITLLLQSKIAENSANHIARFSNKNNKNDSATTDLFNAVSAGNVANVRKAIKNGANVSAFGKKSKCTPIQIAERLGHSEIVSILAFEYAERQNA